MRKFYLCVLIFLISICSGAYAQISLDIRKPVPPYVADTAVNLEVRTTSTYTITSVKAAIGSRQITLTYSAPAYYGRIPIADLQFGNLSLKITATDALGNIKDSIINIIHDAPPMLVIDSSLTYAVATPTLRVRASASDSNAVDSMTLSGPGFSYIFPGNTIDTTINMLNGSAPDGSETFLRITATDNRNQKTTKVLTIYIEESPYLERVFTSPYGGKIVDFKYNKVLIEEEDSFHHHIVDIQTKATTEIPVYKQLRISQAFLTPYGAFFSTQHPNPYYYDRSDSIYEWNNGVFTIREENNYPFMVVAGNYAIWARRFFAAYLDSFHVREFSTGVNHGIKHPNYGNYDGNHNLIAKNGLGFFQRNFDGGTKALLSYYNGQITELSFLTGRGMFRPLSTDGRELLYTSVEIDEYGNVTTSDSLFKTTNNLTSGSVISKLLFDPESTHPMLNNGYAAYVRYDDSVKIDKHLYLWDSTGHIHQKTFWTNQNGIIDKIKVLDSAGNFIFGQVRLDYTNTGDGYYYAGNDGSLLKLTDYIPFYGLGEPNDVYLENGQYYIAIGNALFKVHVTPQEAVTSFTVNMKLDSVHTFTKQEFEVNYNSATPLVNVKIVTVPSHGVLTVNGRTITANNIVVADSIRWLKYTPVADYIGLDTASWNASSNGSTYTGNNALITFNITENDSLPVPIVTGIYSQYCGNTIQASGMVVNPPASGVNILITLDDSQVLSLRPNGEFVFNPSILVGGAHQIKVRYANAADTTSTTISFTLLPITIPDLTLTANITTINTAADTVIITAGIPGGYKNPLYSFAWDRNFNNLIQWESVNNVVTIPPDAFATGNNRVYGKVLTGNGCASSVTAIDSITIVRSIVTAVPDVDVPGKMILAYPNPFNGPVTIKGFQVGKQYTLSLYDMQGKLILKKRVYQQDKTEINIQNRGNYILQINDDTKKRLLGSLQIIRI